MIRILLLRASLLVAILSGIAVGSDIGLAPMRLELVVPPGGTATEVVTLATNAREPQQIRVATSDWSLDPDGSVVHFPADSLPDSAALWVEPETSDLLLEPRSARSFRVTVRVPDEPDLAGTYHAMTFFEVVPAASGADGVGIATTTRIALAVYVTVAGTARDAAALTDVFDQDGRLVLAVANDGNTVQRLGGQVELRDETGQVVDRLPVPDVPVLRGSERLLRIPLPDTMRPGFYVALALVEPSRSGLLVGEYPLTVE